MSPCAVICSFFLMATLIRPSSSATDSFIYVGCTRLRYSPASPYDSNLNSLLTSLVNSAISPSLSASFNTFTISGGRRPSDTVHGLYQCRGDLGSGPRCGHCVSSAVNQLADLCPRTCGAALQLDGCYVKYDNASFLRVQDKAVAYAKCGAPARPNPDWTTRRDAVLEFIGGGAGQYFRVGGSGSVQAMAQCTGDLSSSDCQDCVAEGIERLKGQCGGAEWGDMFLAKCYARYWEGGKHSQAWCCRRRLGHWSLGVLALWVGLAF